MGKLEITISFCILILVCPHFYYCNDALDFIMSALRGERIVNLHLFLIGWSSSCLLGFIRVYCQLIILWNDSPTITPLMH